MFIPGFMSKMNGKKALALEEWCRSDNRPFVRFDYTGIGASEGKIVRFSDWIEDACDVFAQLTKGPQIVVGSSMGGYMMLQVAKRFPERVAGMIGAAPSFFKTVNQLKMQNGPYALPSHYAQDGAYELPATFNDGISDFDLFPTADAVYTLRCKLYILHGMLDDSVPYTDSLKFVQSCIGKPEHEVNLVLSKLGEHRLSEDADISLLLELLQRMVRQS
uniref:Mycophenolic acid acyl-glucuronide esterase, mitochondrial-like n=1 Tax=Phallusia mammillata TaxID=59560 RepID=A0A6F9D625_9ASCI|nr:mycophenolic acid acyl-glucuronide esterase, mitochondrial-like [Phallusia mammillata]